jgi:hypothetical protein
VDTKRISLSEVIEAVRSDRGARAFVWSVWLIMMMAATFFFVKYGRVFPLNEDWWVVRPLTGNEPNLAEWLWKQNSEHRIPFPRLILLALLKVTHGDFRAGMIFTILLLGALAFALIHVARHVRGGRTSFADAFFPIVLLNLGHAENMYWGWQITQVIPTVLTSVMLLVIVGYRTLATPGAAVVAGITLMLLPLSGANGLISVPVLALWLGYCGMRQWLAPNAREGQQWTGGFLIGSAVVTLCLMGLYFVGYERPTWLPPHPGLGAALRATTQFLALGFGPIARTCFGLSTIAAIAILLPSAIVAVLAVLRHKGQERHRALGVLVFFGNTGVYALAMGWGRAAAIPFYGGWPLRYMLFAVPAVCTAFFVWELYGPTGLRSAVLSGLLLVMLVLMPLNTMQGFDWLNWFPERDRSLEQDLMSGVPPFTLAERHRELLLHWEEPGEIADYMRMLRDAGITPFAQMAEDPVTTEDSIPSEAFKEGQPHAQPLAELADVPLVTQGIRYYMPEAGEAYLVWGLNGWHVAPERLRPAGTEVKDNVMHTPMIQRGDTFVAKLAVPAETAIDYYFRITKKRDSFDITWPLCEGNYREVPTEDGVTEVETDLTLALVGQEIRYRMPEAGEVHLVWGLNGWHVAPEELRPTGTEVKKNVMHTPMVREGDTFVANLRVPAGTTINYCFLSTRRGLFDVVYPVCDSGDQGDQMVVSDDGIMEVKAAVTLSMRLWDVLGFWGVLDKSLYFLAGAGVLLCTWLAAFFVLGFVDG